MARSALLRQLARLLQVAVATERGQFKPNEVEVALAMRREGQSTQAILHELNRRQFLEAAGIGIAALSTGTLAAACKSTGRSGLRADAPLNSQGRVVVVGAGTAGLTAAYRLQQAGIAATIYEGSARVGGRMFTQQDFNIEGMFCERGGELVDSQHTDLIKLCDELGLGIQEIRTMATGTTRELYFIGGALRSDEEVVAAFKPLARLLAKDLATISPGGTLTVPTFNSDLAKNPAVQNLDRMTFAEYIQRSGADRWLIDLISIAYTGEYGLETSQQSALNLLTFIGMDTSAGFQMFGSSDESKRIAGGNQSLPKALAALIEAKQPIRYEHRLTAIADHGSSFTLSFNNGGTASVEVAADQLILALPIAMLREVDLSRVNMSPLKRQAIANWGIGTNTKYMLGFKSRVWNTRDNQAGFSCYSDTAAQDIWDTSRGQTGESGILTAFLGGDRGRTTNLDSLPAILKGIGQVMPTIPAAFDGNKVLQSWPNAPFAKGSYTCCKPGHYTTIYGAPGEPELGGRMVFAGEHCSVDWSGFMNGAVQTGNQAAASVLAKAGK